MQGFMDEFAHSFIIVGEVHPVALSRRPEHLDGRSRKLVPQVPAMLVKMHHHVLPARLFKERPDVRHLGSPGDEDPGG